MEGEEMNNQLLEKDENDDTVIKDCFGRPIVAKHTGRVLRKEYMDLLDGY